MKAILREFRDFYKGKQTKLTEDARATLLSIGFIERVEPKILRQNEYPITNAWWLSHEQSLAFDQLTPFALSQIKLLGMKKAIYRALGKKTCIERIWAVVMRLLSM